MKLGLSFHLCALDIMSGLVPESDVLVIVTRTDFDPHNDEQWKQIYRGYTTAWSPLGFTEGEWRDLATRLYDTGRLHQPRQYGKQYPYMPTMDHHWMELVPTLDQIHKNPALQQAWEDFRLIAKLSSEAVD